MIFYLHTNYHKLQNIEWFSNMQVIGGS